MSEATDGGTSEAFGLDAGLAQELQESGLDPSQLGLTPVESTSETSAESTNAEATAEAGDSQPTPAPQAEVVAEVQETTPAVEAPAASQQDAVQAPSDSFNREQVDAMLEEARREEQGRKDREIHQMRMEQTRAEGEAKATQDRERLLQMDPGRDGAEYLRGQQQAAQQPLSAEEIANETARRIYSDQLLNPIQHSRAFEALDSDQFQERLAGSGISFQDNPNAAGDVVSWAIKTAQEQGVELGRQQAEAARTEAAAKVIQETEAPVDTGGSSAGARTLDELMGSTDPSDFSTLSLGQLEEAAKAQGISDLSEAMFEEAPGLPSNR